MYPFEDRRKWILANRYGHALAVAQDIQLGGQAQEILDERMDSLERWLKVRVGILILLTAGAITTVVSLIVDYLQGVDGGGVAEAARGVERLSRRIAQIGGSLSGILALSMLAVNRLLGQYEVDILGLLATKTQK